MFKTTVKTTKETSNETNLLVTINSSQRSDPNNHTPYDEHFRKVIEEVFNDLGDYLKPQNEAYGTTLTGNVIDATNDISFEYSTKNFIHCHVVVTIKQKKGYYLIDLIKMRSNLISKLGNGKDIHLNVKRIASVASVQKYTEKNY